MRASFASIATAGALAVLSVAALPAAADRKSAPDDAYAYIVSPAHGQTVPQTFTVIFGLEGFGVAPAGVERDNTGHHHLLINVDELPPMDRPLPATDNIVHFGAGQTQTTLRLEPGKHTLQLLMGDHTHTPHYPSVKSQKITITVRPDPTPAPSDERKGSPLKLF